MVQNVKTKLAALRQMTPAQLRDRYMAVFGEPTRTGNKDFLCKRIAWRLQSLAEDSLSDRARQRAAELACDAAKVYGKVHNTNNLSFQGRTANFAITASGVYSRTYHRFTGSYYVIDHNHGSRGSYTASR